MQNSCAARMVYTRAKTKITYRNRESPRKGPKDYYEHRFQMKFLLSASLWCFYLEQSMQEQDRESQKLPYGKLTGIKVERKDTEKKKSKNADNPLHHLLLLLFCLKSKPTVRHLQNTNWERCPWALDEWGLSKNLELIMRAVPCPLAWPEPSLVMGLSPPEARKAAFPLLLTFD